jgi:hypothetical protein
LPLAFIPLITYTLLSEIGIEMLDYTTYNQPWAQALQDNPEFTLLAMDARQRYEIAYRLYRLAMRSDTIFMPMWVSRLRHDIALLQREYPDYLFPREAKTAYDAYRALPAPNRIQYATRPYSCDFCGERFDKRKALIPYSGKKLCTACAVEHGVDPRKARRWGSRRKVT